MSLRFFSLFLTMNSFDTNPFGVLPGAKVTAMKYGLCAPNGLRRCVVWLSAESESLAWVFLLLGTCAYLPGTLN